MKKSNRIVVITGASSGIGLATRQFFESRGDIVIDFSLSTGVDVTDVEKVTKAFAKVHAEHGRIDVLINNAGFGISGASENTTQESIKKIFDVNFVGLANCCNAVLPFMREQKSGKIINISSVSAVFPLHFQSFYSATKAAVTNYTSALRREVFPFGIRVCSVLPGDVNTGFVSARVKNKNDDPVYEKARDRAITKYERDEHKGAKPEWIAKKLYKVSSKKNPKPYIVLGFSYKCLVFLNGLLPNRFVNWLVHKNY